MILGENYTLQLWITHVFKPYITIITVSSFLLLLGEFLHTVVVHQ